MKSDSVIASVIENFPVSANCKEARTGKFIVNNLMNARQFGLENPEDLAGLTIRDLHYSRPDWGAEYAKQIEKLDFQVVDKKCQVIDTLSFLHPSGEAQLEQMIKFPLLSARKKLLGIFTYRHDITRSLPPERLYRLYRNFYTAEHAIGRVLVCLDIDKFFDQPPTEAQIRVLLFKSERLSNKQIGKLLRISDRTVASHLEALRNKVKDRNLALVQSLVYKNTAPDPASVEWQRLS